MESGFLVNVYIDVNQSKSIMQLHLFKAKAGKAQWWAVAVDEATAATLVPLLKGVRLQIEDFTDKATSMGPDYSGLAAFLEGRSQGVAFLQTQPQREWKLSPIPQKPEEIAAGSVGRSQPKKIAGVSVE